MNPNRSQYTRVRYILQDSKGRDIAAFTDVFAILAAARQQRERGLACLIMTVRPGHASQARLQEFVELLCRDPNFLPF